MSPAPKDQGRLEASTPEKPSAQSHDRRIRWLALLFVVSFVGLRVKANFCRRTLTTSDRGRDLYTASLVLKGKLPYRDFDWPYGPLAPFCYAACLRVLGASVRSYDLAELAMAFAVAMLVYRLALEVIGLPLAIVPPLLWPFIFGVRGHSGNYVPAQLLAALSLLFAVRLLHRKGSPNVNVCAGLAFVGLLTLTKLNTGLSWLAGICIVVLPWYRMEQRASAKRVSKQPGAGDESPPPAGDLPDWRVCAAALGVTFLVVGAVYLALTIGVPKPDLYRCFPFGKGRHHDYGPVQKYLIQQLDQIFSKPLGRAFLIQMLDSGALLFVLCLAAAGVALLTPFRPDAAGKKEVTDILLLLSVMVTSGHEFLMSGTWYSLNYLPSLAMAVLPVLLVKLWSGGIGTAVYGKENRRRVEHALTAFAVLLVAALLDHEVAGVVRADYRYVPLPRARFSQFHEPQFADWSVTVTQVTRFITSNTDAGEPILVVPFDPLYLFLADRPQVCRTVDFSTYQKVAPAEEEGIIRMMEENKVRLVVRTNTTVILNGNATEFFGATHCKTLAAYIEEHYRTAVHYGEKDPVGYSYTRHGVDCLLRSTPFTSGERDE